MRISILSSGSNHPVYVHLRSWAERQGIHHSVELVESADRLSGGDLLFIVSCSEIISVAQRAAYRIVFVLHASDVPTGRGWSPHVWQILEGNNEIMVSLLTADDRVDSGAIWAQQQILLEGHELFDEINEKLFSAELALMDLAVSQFGQLKPQPQPNRKPTYYRKRAPEDSRLDPDQTIAQQIDLLRVVDPERFPAYFDLRGHRYIVTIRKAPGPKP